MLQVSIETGILRANICRYVAEMFDKEQIQVKIKLLRALKDGYLETSDIPELDSLIGDRAPKGSIPIEEWIKDRIK